MCSYCGCQSISLVGRFMAEHEQLVNLTGDLHRAQESGDAPTVEVALTGILAVLHPHAGAEEAGLFAVLRRNPDFTDHVDGLCAEHTALDTLAGRVRAGEHDLIHEFITMLRHHMDKEDNGLFPAAAIELDGPAWDEAVSLTPAGPGTHNHAHGDGAAHSH